MIYPLSLITIPTSTAPYTVLNDQVPSSDGASFVFYESIGVHLPKEAFGPSGQVMYTDCGCMTKLLFLSFTTILYSATYMGRKLLIVYTVLRRTVCFCILICSPGHQPAYLTLDIGYICTLYFGLYP